MAAFAVRVDVDAFGARRAWVDRPAILPVPEVVVVVGGDEREPGADERVREGRFLVAEETSWAGVGGTLPIYAISAAVAPAPSRPVTQRERQLELVRGEA